MSAALDRNRYRCDDCGAILLRTQLLTAPSSFDPEYTLTACPWCRRGDESFTYLCDEPGCDEPGCCGWPTGNTRDEWEGYRTTCGKHYGGANAHP